MQNTKGCLHHFLEESNRSNEKFVNINEIFMYYTYTLKFSYSEWSQKVNFFYFLHNVYK